MMTILQLLHDSPAVDVFTYRRRQPLQSQPGDSGGFISSRSALWLSRTTSQHILSPIYTGQLSATSHLLFIVTVPSGEEKRIRGDIMNKLLVITVLVALLAINAESFRVARQAEDVVEEEGSLSKISNAFKAYYDSTLDSASGYLDSIRGLKLEEKAQNLYHDTTTAGKTYYGILHDQLYYVFYPSQN